MILQTANIPGILLIYFLIYRNSGLTTIFQNIPAGKDIMSTDNRDRGANGVVLPRYGELFSDRWIKGTLSIIVS
jgi:hypothetical protein